MAKLIVLGLALTALVAFTSAHTTILTTTIENAAARQQCSRQLQGERFNQCQMYLQQDQSPYDNTASHQQQHGIQQCCQELQRIDNQCMCEAVTQIFGEAQQMQQQQQGQQGGRYGAQQIQWLKQKAQNLPNKCNIRTQKCQIRTVITTTIIDDENRSRDFSQGCRQIVRTQPLDQCQRLVSLQSRTPRTILMGINRQQPEEMQQCCNEIRNIKEECHCEAIKEIYNEVITRQQREGRYYGARDQQLEKMRQKARQVVQNLPNQCDLEIERCNIPSEMF